MDPISALNLAANIYAFVEAGFKVVHQYNDFRRNALSESQDNAERRIITENLRNISSQLATEGHPFLVELGENCNRLSQELLGLLGKLKVNNPDSVRERVWVIFKCWLRSRDIASLEDRLETYRTQLIVGFLPILRNEQSKFNEKLDQFQTELRQLRDSRADELTKLRSDLIAAMRLSENQLVRTSSDRVGSLLLELRDLVKVSSPEAAILTQLRSSDIYDREDAIKDATEGTFAWVMQEVSSNAAPGTTFNGLEKSLTPWLQSGSGVFHISGKAGSGKSTLMKHIWLHPRTQEHLKMWAGDKKLLRAAFFFWAAGNTEQKSLTGLYRSILFSVLTQDRSLIPQVFPEYWKNSQLTPHGIDRLIRPSAVEAAFQALLSKRVGSAYRICLFIDGLDEYEAPDRESYSKLVERLGSWADESSGNVKLCVSSRPYVEFEDAFGPCRDPSRKRIHLHEFNRPDIEEHCRNTLSQAKSHHGITNPERAKLFSRQIEESSEDLIQEIGYRAEGVFLWAVLVLRMIISEARRGGSHRDLEKKLEETPGDIDRLYSKMLNSLNPSERELSNRLFFVVLTYPFRNNISALCMKWLSSKDAWKSRLAWGNDDYARKDVIADINYITRHLDVWTHGLIETDNGRHLYSPLSVFGPGLRFCHRTARDYFLQPMQLSKLQSAFEGFELARLHADLRLTELTILKHIEPFVLGLNSVCRYGYEILTVEPNTSLGPIVNQIGEYQVTWPVIEELTRILPCRCLVPVPGWWHALPVYDSLMFIEAKQTSLHHLSASLGLDRHGFTEGLKLAESGPSQSNLLLSACLSGLYFRNPPIIEQVPARDLVRSLLDKGFSAYNRVKMAEYFPSRSPDRTATVWMILVSGLLLPESVTKDVTSLLVHSAKGLIDVIRELLCCETQEEVLLLIMLDESDGTYGSFITLEDVLRGLGIMSTDVIFDRLQGWPKYEAGGPVSEGAPSWVWENWRGRPRYPIANSLEKITFDDLEKSDKFFLHAVASRKDFVELNKGEFLQSW